MMKIMTLNIQAISCKVSNQAGVKLYMARVDKIHPLASGNKYYKLKPNIEYAKQQGHKQILSFGGAYSNHIHALALFAHAQGLETIGIIRGEPEYAKNPTMQDVLSAGMTLEFVDRQEYRLRTDNDYLANLQQRYPDALIIPEGGSSQRAVASCRQLMHEINNNISCDIVTAACGTGATFAGLASGLSEHQTAIAYSALRDDSLQDSINSFLENEGKKEVRYSIESAAFGGFAKLNREMLDFILEWLDDTDILLDPIYTGKMAFRLLEQIKEGQFSPDTSICMVHSGGLQGWRGMKRRVIKLGGLQSWAIIRDKLKCIDRAMDCQNA